VSTTENRETGEAFRPRRKAPGKYFCWQDKHALNQISHHPGITDYAIVMLLYYTATRMASDQAGDFDGNRFQVTYAGWGQQFGMSASTVKRFLPELLATGTVTRERIYDHARKQFSPDGHIYTLTETATPSGRGRPESMSTGDQTLCPKTGADSDPILKASLKGKEESAKRDESPSPSSAGEPAQGEGKDKPESASAPPTRPLFLNTWK
jgi:hypothetical protein